MYEKTLDANVVEGLKARGHKIEKVGSGGRTQAIAVNEENQLVGVADPRGAGKALGE